MDFNDLTVEQKKQLSEPYHKHFEMILNSYNKEAKSGNIMLASTFSQIVIKPESDKIVKESTEIALNLGFSQEEADDMFEDMEDFVAEMLIKKTFSNLIQESLSQCNCEACPEDTKKACRVFNKSNPLAN